MGSHEEGPGLPESDPQLGILPASVVDEMFRQHRASIREQDPVDSKTTSPRRKAKKKSVRRTKSLQLPADLEAKRRGFKSDSELKEKHDKFLHRFSEQRKHARMIARFVMGHVATVNLCFLAYAGYGIYRDHWPTDKLILGWFASVVVEIIGLYAIVLRGMFTSKCNKK